MVKRIICSRRFSGMLFYLMLLMPVLFTGCFQTSNTVWLNPDGSGKIQMDSLLPVIALFEQDTTIQSLKTQMANDVRSIVSDSSGIEAWSGVSYELTDEGQMHFKGTAYFEDISEVSIKNLLQGGVSFAPDPSGNRVLLVNEEPREEKNESSASQLLTEEEIEERIKTEKIKFRQAKPMFSAFLEDFRMEFVFHLPGRVVSTVNLRELEGGKYGFSIDGKQVIKVLDVLSADDEWWRKQIVESVNIIQDGPLGDEMNEKLLGEKGPVKAVVSAPFSPLFNYGSELASARKETEKLKEMLNIPVGQDDVAEGEENTVETKMAGGIMWRKDLQGVEIPGIPVQGVLRGKEFRCKQAFLEGNILHLRQGEDFFADLELVIFFFLKENESLEKRTFEVAPNRDFGNPHIHMKWKSKDEDFSPKTEIFMNDYSMRIEFEAVSEGILPGKIYLCLPDEDKSVVAGRFEAEIK